MPACACRSIAANVTPFPISRSRWCASLGSGTSNGWDSIRSSRVYASEVGRGAAGKASVGCRQAQVKPLCWLIPPPRDAQQQTDSMTLSRNMPGIAEQLCMRRVFEQPHTQTAAERVHLGQDMHGLPQDTANRINYKRSIEVIGGHLMLFNLLSEQGVGELSNTGMIAPTTETTNVGLSVNDYCRTLGHSSSRRFTYLSCVASTLHPRDVGGYERWM